jgi:23S rRNA pseudouridine1911/1915/1917 synthase
MSSDRFPITISVPAEAAGQRLDQFLTAQIPDISRSRVQQLLQEEKALVDGATAKPSYKLRGGEQLTILGDPQPPPLRAIAEDIPLDIVYEDGDLAVVNKPAGMMVHAGAGATEDERNRGTLVNALLHRFARLSDVGGELRPGIVHRLDKETSGLILVAKNDTAHRKLGEQFSRREIKKRYVALVHGWPAKDRGTISSAISRDSVRRIRMTTRGSGGRTAITHYEVREKIASPFGKFALLDVRIETGRTHQIRVHLSSAGHPVVGDTLYGAPKQLKRTTAPARGSMRHRSVEEDSSPALESTASSTTQLAASQSASPAPSVLALNRNFLHAASIEFTQPRTGKAISFEAALPAELVLFLEQLRA